MNCVIKRMLLKRGPMLWQSSTYVTSPILRTSENNNNDVPIDMENPYQKEKPLCILCKYQINPDYKNVKLLSQFQSPFTGRVYGRHITGLCTKKQSEIEKEIIKAQSSGFMPYYIKDTDFLNEPKLFDPERPLRPHSYA